MLSMVWSSPAEVPWVLVWVWRLLHQQTGPNSEEQVGPHLLHLPECLQMCPSSKMGGLPRSGT